jgi:hypothetical protein
VARHIFLFNVYGPDRSALWSGYSDSNQSFNNEPHRRLPRFCKVSDFIYMA